MYFTSLTPSLGGFISNLLGERFGSGCGVMLGCIGTCLDGLKKTTKSTDQYSLCSTCIFDKCDLLLAI